MNVYAAESFEEGGEPKLIKSKKLQVRPMSVEEAALQMDLLNNDFYIFTNITSKSLNVIYRMKDGHYGLIEPQGG
jgi:putative sigma-54 modulation protein